MIKLGTFNYDRQRLLIIKGNRHYYVSFQTADRLETFILNSGVPLSYQWLQETFELPSYDAVRAFARTLRHKVEDDPYNPLHLITVYGYGFVWRNHPDTPIKGVIKAGNYLRLRKPDLEYLT